MIARLTVYSFLLVALEEWPILAQDTPSMPAESAPQTMEHSGSEHAGMHGAYGPYPMTREASGTAWQPDGTPMEGRHIMIDDWMLMLHGFAFGIYTDQGGKRGNDDFFSENMFMLMAQHPLPGGTFGFRTMLPSSRPPSGPEVIRTCCKPAKPRMAETPSSTASIRTI